MCTRASFSKFIWRDLPVKVSHLPNITYRFIKNFILFWFRNLFSFKAKQLMSLLKTYETKRGLTGAVGSCASGLGVSVEWKWCGGALGHALCEEALPPPVGRDPWGGGDGGHQEEDGDGATCECDNLEKWPHYYKLGSYQGVKKWRHKGVILKIMRRGPLYCEFLFQGQRKVKGNSDSMRE